MKTFKSLIEHCLGCEVPLPVGNYEVKTGKLEIVEEDKATFMKLYKLSPNKAIGNGEIALYWLFYPHSKETHGGSAADLLLLGNSVEVKSYKSHNYKIKLGKFATDKESRKKLTQVFGIANTVGINKLKYTKMHPNGYVVQDFVSEVAFTVFDIYTSYEKVVELRDQLTQCKNHIPMLNMLNNELIKMFDGIQEKTNQQQVEELTKSLVTNIVVSKLGKKPGKTGGFVCNISCKDPLDIMFFEIKTKQQLLETLKEKTIQDLADLFSVENGEIVINYNKLL